MYKISVHRSNIVVAVDIRYIGGSGEHDTGYSQEEDYFMEIPPSEWLTRLQVAHHPFDLSVMNFVPALISLTISTVVISSVLNVPSIVELARGIVIQRHNIIRRFNLITYKEVVREPIIR